MVIKILLVNLCNFVTLACVKKGHIQITSASGRKNNYIKSPLTTLQVLLFNPEEKCLHVSNPYRHDRVHNLYLNNTYLIIIAIT